MALPSLGTRPRYLEELRIGGGYLSSPDGGVDMDKAGNVALDGDLTVGGDFALASGGLNRTWSRNLLARDAALGVTGAAEGPLSTANTIFQSNFSFLAFDPSSREWAHWAFALPSDYDGSTLKFTIYWYAAAGTVSGTVTWRVRVVCLNDGNSSTTGTGTGVGATDTIVGLTTIHAISLTMTPDSPTTGGLLAVSLERMAESDTFDGDARFIALQVAYA